MKKVAIISVLFLSVCGEMLLHKQVIVTFGLNHWTPSAMRVRVLLSKYQ